MTSCPNRLFGSRQRVRYHRRRGSIGAKRALPELDDLPPCRFERDARFSVASLVASELRKPILWPRNGQYRPSASRMLVPKATMHEKRQAQPWKNQIGAARKITPVKSEAIAEGVCDAPYTKFRLGVLGADPGHIGASLFRSMSFHQVARDKNQINIDSALVRHFLISGLNFWHKSGTNVSAILRITAL